jgi:plastocyanin
MRRGAVAGVLAGVASLVAAPALADGPAPTVIATTENEFFPKTLTVQPGTEITWENRGLDHNVKFDDGSFEQPPDPTPFPWQVQHRFEAAGTFRYYCESHGGPNGQGMSGTIIVEENVQPKLTDMRVKPAKICSRKTRKCRKAKGRIRFTLSEDARVFGGIDPVGAPAGRKGADLEMEGKQGPNSILVRGRKFKPGRYKVTLAAEDTDGNDSDVSTAFFRVKRARR